MTIALIVSGAALVVVLAVVALYRYGAALERITGDKRTDKREP